MALEDEAGIRSAWFAWARVSVDGIERVAARAAMSVEEVWERNGRWFAQLAPAHHTVSNSS